MRCTYAILVLFILFPVSSQAQWSSSRPDGHAPIGVMGDHTHGAGEFMFSYRYMYMNMDGNRDGTSELASSDVVDPNGYNFLVSPVTMPMGMHMVGLMYAPTDAITLMAMVPFVTLEMDHVTRAGGAFTTSAQGLGDVRLSGLITVAQFGNSRLHLNVGVSIPVGSIETMDVTPMSAPNETQLPYPMQLGSGTFDLLPGATYLGQSGSLSWGLQVAGTVRLGENDQAYTLGNKIMATGWSAVEFAPWISGSARVEANAWDDIDGASSAFTGPVNMRMVPTVFPELRGGNRVDVGFGINLYARKGAIRGLRFAIEAMLPVAQDLHGPQLETDLIVIGGLQYAL